MSNVYEPLRNDVIKTLHEVCIVESNDKARIAYTWNIGKVFGVLEKTLPQVVLNGKLPETLKDIVRFEFNKLKDDTMADKNWTAIRSTKSFTLTPDGIERRRQDLFGLKAITLDEQLKGAQILLDKVGMSLSKSSNEESTIRLNKRRNRLLKEIMFIKESQVSLANAIAEQKQSETKEQLVEA